MRPVNCIGEPFFELSEVDSSNNYAMRQAQAQLAVHGATWFAHFQYAGKGQRGKVWSAEPGQNIMMSIIIEPGFLSIDNQFVLNAMVAIACYDFFTGYAIDKTSIKWPNDIFWEDRKAGGILIENSIQGNEWKFSVAGIGININQTFFPPSIKNAVSLKQITGKTFTVTALAKELCQCIEKRWRQLLAGQEEELMNEYCSHLYKLNQKAVFKKQNTEFSGVVTGVNKKGELLINTETHSTIAYGTVEWVLP